MSAVVLWFPVTLNTPFLPPGQHLRGRFAGHGRNNHHGNPRGHDHNHPSSWTGNAGSSLCHHGNGRWCRWTSKMSWCEKGTLDSWTVELCLVVDWSMSLCLPQVAIMAPDMASFQTVEEAAAYNQDEVHPVTLFATSNGTHIAVQVGWLTSWAWFTPQTDPWMNFCFY